MRRARLAALLLVVLAAGACGVPTDDEPRALPAERVPFGLLQPSPTGDDPGVPGEATMRSVYLVDADGKLVEVRKEVPSPGDAAQTLRTLFEGPDTGDVEEGNNSFIPPGTLLLDVEGPVQGVVTIDLTGDLPTGGENLRTALGQIVYTATGIDGVDRVLFELNGQPREVPDDTGETTAEPLGRSDFSEFRPEG